ncbi:TAXI family TRAP transporter solute-binding subunit [Brachybacterium sp. EF45031]|uniref:TAXI family TRAP transporter solute-binding subunit n=1 Tax=Brachybacterium sillae TaxID=2810536 RepID=UPI00217DF652|nr:TAXI family TRAP transporter solute-binding subunit [Brachybacterium sillae]MCS6712240.1 TAXI family TRAP transporter solute-binding subunit [Brachybacterium sillae]
MTIRRRSILLTSPLVAAGILSACSRGGSGATGGGGSDAGGAAGGEDFRTDLTFGTGGTGGVYYPLGGEYSTIFQDNIEGITVNYTDSGASVENIGQIFQGEWQLGISQSDTANAAVKGEGDFEGAQVSNLGWIAALYPEAAHIVTLADSGISTVEDLAGKRIAVGDIGSGTRAASDAILAAHGIEDGGYEPFEQDFSTSLDLLRDGNIDASIFVVGTPTGSLGDLAATNEVRLIGMTQAKADEISGSTPYEPYTIEASAYDFVTEPVITLSVAAALVASMNQVSPEVGYEITKAIFEHAGEITLPQGKLISTDYALSGRGDVPLHPGAEQYYQEQGLI